MGSLERCIFMKGREREASADPLYPGDKGHDEFDGEHCVVFVSSQRTEKSLCFWWFQNQWPYSYRCRVLFESWMERHA